jgi:hypothetical protein
MKRVLCLVILAACSKGEDKKPAPEPGKPGVISGSIEIQADRQAGLTPGHVIYVSAKKKQQPGPPLAAKKMEIGAFPIAFELSSADQMMAGGPPLEGDVELTVRFDGDGDVMSRGPGDLVWKGPATVGGPPLKVLVSEPAQ